MINKIWNWVKNIFVPEKQAPHLTLYEEVKPVVNEYTDKDGKSKPDLSDIAFAYFPVAYFGIMLLGNKLLV